MLSLGVLAVFLSVSHGMKFMSSLEDAANYYSKDVDSIWRDIIDEMGRDLDDSANSFMDSNEYDNVKEIMVPLDYDAAENLNPNPSIRDQEYLRHSTLWSYQRPNNQDNIKHKIQKIGFKGNVNDKNSLPTYCTPPNPCPIGYTAEDHCLVEFENTAAFSRDFQNAQECMCDGEHMVDCPSTSDRDELSDEQIDSNYNIIENYQEKNPYFHGEKLPVAAKKGLNVIY